VDANFRLTVLSLKGDTVLFKNFNLKNDFKNTGAGSEQTDWFLSKNEIKGLWGVHTIRFDWYDNLGEAGIFGGFSFAASELDYTPPKWHFVSLGTFDPGTKIVVMTTENAGVYLVPQGTLPDTTSIKAAAISSGIATAYKQANLVTSVSDTGGFVAYAIDASGNISEATKVIMFQYPVSAAQIAGESEIKVSYNHANQVINVKGTSELSYVSVYNILGKKVVNTKCYGNTSEIQTKGFISGVYLIHVFEKEGSLKVVKIIITNNQY
jgi:hypothetical protein